MHSFILHDESLNSKIPTVLRKFRISKQFLYAILYNFIQNENAYGYCLSL